jgi:hypothetical protein
MVISGRPRWPLLRGQMRLTDRMVRDRNMEKLGWKGGRMGVGCTYMVAVDERITYRM